MDRSAIDLLRTEHGMLMSTMPVVLSCSLKPRRQYLEVDVTD
jgi:hypothetical protein